MSKIGKFFGEGSDLHLTLAELDVIVDSLDKYDVYLRGMFDTASERRLEYIDQKALRRRIKLAAKARRSILRSIEP